MSEARQKALALMAAGVSSKQAAAQLGVTWSATRTWKSLAAKAAREAQQAGLEAASKAVALAQGQSGQSAGTSPSEPADDSTARARAKALKVLSRAAAGHKYPEAQVSAAKALLTATKTAGGRNPGEGASDSAASFRAMHDDELIERMLVTACSQWGLERVKARLQALDAAGQADAGGPHYPMPALLGGTERPQTPASIHQGKASSGPALPESESKASATAQGAVPGS